MQINARLVKPPGQEEAEKKKGGKDLLDLGGAGCREKRHCFCEGAWSC